MPFWTNTPFLICVILLFIISGLVVFMPADTGIMTFFNMLPFVDEKTGESYYSYRYWVALGIAANSIITWCAEKLIVGKMTRKFDERVKVKKQRHFEE